MALGQLPAICKENVYNSSGTELRFIAGSEVVCNADKRDSEGRYAIASKDGILSAWVFSCDMHVGTKQLGKPKVVLDGSHYEPSSSLAHDTSGEGTPLKRSIFGIVKEMARKEGLLRSVGAKNSIVSRINQNPTAVAQAVWASLTREVKDKLNNGNERITELSPSRATKTQAVMAVYCIIYDKDRIGLYVGESNNVGGREEQHQNAVNNPNYKPRNPHYASARKSRKVKLVLLATFTEDDPDLRFITENLMIGLMGAYHLALVNGKASGTNAELTMARCRAIEDIVAATCMQTGYRRSQSTRGLNWATPIVANHPDEVGWLRLDLQDRYVFKSLKPRRVFLKHGTNTYKVALTPRMHTHGIPDIECVLYNWRPAEFESRVRVVVEIMRRGPHPYPHARMSEIGVTADAGEANSVGVRVEYRVKATEEWRAMFVQRTIRHDFDSYEISRGVAVNVPLAYRSAMLLKEYLMQRAYPSLNDTPAWRALLKPSIMTSEYDWIQQTIKLQRARPSLWTSAPTSVLTVDENRARMKRTFPWLWYIGSRPGSSTGGTRACNLCYLSRLDYDIDGTSEASGSVNCSGGDSCERCARYHRPCTYERLDMLRAYRHDLPRLFHMPAKTIDFAIDTSGFANEVESDEEDV